MYVLELTVILKNLAQLEAWCGRVSLLTLIFFYSNYQNHLSHSLFTFFFFNVGVQVSLCISRLISRALKLTTM